MKKIDIDTFLTYKCASTPRFSPDGKKLAFIVNQPQPEENGYGSDLYIYDLDSRKVRPLTFRRHIGVYAWTGAQEIVFSDRTADDDETSYFCQNIVCGDARHYFTAPGRARSLYALDNGKLAVLQNIFIGEETPDTAYEVMTEVPFWSNGAGFTYRRRTGIFIYDPQGNRLEKITEPFEDCLGMDVMDHRILYTSYSWTDVRPVKPGMRLYDCRSGSVREIMAPGEMFIGAAVLCGNDSVIFAATDGTRYGQNQYMDFYQAELASNRTRRVRSYGYSIGGNTVGTDVRAGSGNPVLFNNGKVYFLTTIGESGILKSLDVSGDMELSGDLTNTGSCDSFDVSGEHLAVCGFFGDRLSELYVDGCSVTNFSKALDGYTIAAREYIKVPSRDGTMIHGFVMKPVDFDPEKTYPAILNIHGGPRTVFGGIFHHEMQMLAARGYFVFYCNPRGSDGRGNVFGDIDGRFGTIDYEDIMAFTDGVLKHYPQIDAGCLGVMGGSYGGFMTNWIIGHTDRFKAAVSMRCVTNWISMEFMSDIGSFFVPQSMGASAFDDVLRLWEQSPLKYAGNCKTPTLFIHSDEDYRCPLAEGMQMFAALKLVGCKTRLCVMKGENHELSRSGRPSRRIRRMKEIVAWMDEHLKGGLDTERQVEV